MESKFDRILAERFIVAIDKKFTRNDFTIDRFLTKSNEASNHKEILCRENIYDITTNLIKTDVKHYLDKMITEINTFLSKITLDAEDRHFFKQSLGFSGKCIHIKPEEQEICNESNIYKVLRLSDFVFSKNIYTNSGTPSKPLSLKRVSLKKYFEKVYYDIVIDNYIDYALKIYPLINHIIELNNLISKHTVVLNDGSLSFTECLPDYNLGLESDNWIQSVREFIRVADHTISNYFNDQKIEYLTFQQNEISENFNEVLYAKDTVVKTYSIEGPDIYPNQNSHIRHTSRFSMSFYTDIMKNEQFFNMLVLPMYYYNFLRILNEFEKFSWESGLYSTKFEIFSWNFEEVKHKGEHKEVIDFLEKF